MSWKINQERIQKTADRLLSLMQISEPPVAIEQIARLRGVPVRSIPHENSLVGLLLWEGGSPVIGINALHDNIQQRFAIAHELAHIELHHYTGIHIDRSFPFPQLFSPLEEQTPLKINPREFEASALACQLLIPTALLVADLKDIIIDYLDDSTVRALAQRYQVRLQTILLRLTH